MLKIAKVERQEPNVLYIRFLLFTSEREMTIINGKGKNAIH